MTRLLMILLAALLLLGGATATGCSKGNEEDCRKAIENVRRLTGTVTDDFGPDPEAAVRSCRGNADRASVRCVMNAQSLAELEQCEGGLADELFGDDDEADKAKAEDPETTPKTE
jgi:hypothetical protein